MCMTEALCKRHRYYVCQGACFCATNGRIPLGGKEFCTTMRRISVGGKEIALLMWLHLQPTPDIVVRLLEKDAQVWERLLFTSGGLLKLCKCLYYIMYWAFDSEGRATLTPSTDIPSLLLTNGHSEDVNPIQQFDCTMAHQYLGLWNSPSLSGILRRCP
jgi:hypothetical protein